MDTSLTITCPNCDHQFQAEDALKKHLNHELAQKSQQLEQDFLARNKELEEKAINIDAQVERTLKEKEGALRSLLAEEVQKEYADSLENYQKKVAAQNEQIKQLRTKEIEIEELKGKLADQGQALELKYKKQLNEKLAQERDKLQESAHAEFTLKLREKEKMLEDQKAQIETMRKKIAQGSMQLQGEAQELILEERLAELFPQDEIAEVPKGVRGADVMQVVRDQGNTCGALLYESKNTQSFREDWIDKLRADQIEAGAQTTILVTTAMPKGFEGDFLTIKGVVVCTVRTFPVVAALCRAKLIDLKHQQSRFHMQKDTMGLLYNYLTGDEFRLHLEEMVNGFISLKDQIEKEKRAFTKQWKERDAQLDKLMMNTSQIYGSIKGIAGSGVKEIKSLELI